MADLVQMARSSGMVGEDVFGAVIAASLMSILLNVFLSGSPSDGSIGPNPAPARARVPA